MKIRTFTDALPEFFAALPGSMPADAAPLSRFLVERIEDAADRADDAQEDALRAAKELLDRAECAVEILTEATTSTTTRCDHIVERATRLALAEQKLVCKRDQLLEIVYTVSGASGAKLMMRIVRERAAAASKVAS